MSPLEFFFGAVLVILGFSFLTFSVRIADRLPTLALICAFMQQAKEPMTDILKAIGLFTAVMGLFVLLAMTGSVLLAKGVLLFLPL